ncbi:MAG: hypothetical protein DYG84_05050 [Candidatus Brocadia sp. AMX3]|nr:hypothetical protein [Candidatus Brocadia sp. AMX3]
MLLNPFGSNERGHSNERGQMTCRGNERRAIFKDDCDKNVFLELLNDGLRTYHIILYCYVLMENHFHLLLETPLANLSEFMRWFNITYTSHYNKRHSAAQPQPNFLYESGEIASEKALAMTVTMHFDGNLQKKKFLYSNTIRGPVICIRGDTRVFSWKREAICILYPDISM